MIAKRNKSFNEKVEAELVLIRLGVEVYDLRNSFNMTQTELAKKVKTTQKVISKIENGDVNIGFDLLNRIAKVLKFEAKNYSRIFNFELPTTICISDNSQKLDVWPMTKQGEQSAEIVPSKFTTSVSASINQVH